MAALSKRAHKSSGRWRAAASRARRPLRSVAAAAATSNLGRCARKRRLAQRSAPVSGARASDAVRWRECEKSRAGRTREVDYARAAEAAEAAAAAHTALALAAIGPAKMCDLRCGRATPRSTSRIAAAHARSWQAPGAPIGGSGASARSRAQSRSLAEVVAQMRAERKTIGRRRRARQPMTGGSGDDDDDDSRPPGHEQNIENCKTNLTRRLLDAKRWQRKRKLTEASPPERIEKKLRPTHIIGHRGDRPEELIGFNKLDCIKQQYTRTTHSNENFKIEHTSTRLSRGHSRDGRSLDKSVRFLHERHFNEQRPPIRRLAAFRQGEAECPVSLMSKPSSQGRPSVTTPSSCSGHSTSSLRPGAAVAAGKRQPMTVARLARRPMRSSEGSSLAAAATTTTKTIRARGGSSGSCVSPYNLRRRAGTASQVTMSATHSPANSSGQNATQQQQQPPPRHVVAPSRKRSRHLWGDTSATSVMPLDEMHQMKARARPLPWHWSEFDKSHECIVSEDKLGVCFHPHSSESAAACRAATPLKRNGNHYYWEVCVQDKCYGTSVMFGVCTKQQRLHTNDYCNLVGLDDQGWSLSHKGLIWHAGQKLEYTSEFPRDQPVTVGVLYDTLRGELSFFMDGKNLGVAFSNLNDTAQDLYPVVGSTAKCTQMRLVSSHCGYVSLLERSCFTLLASARDRYALIDYLRQQNLPSHLLEYVAGEANVDSGDAHPEDREASLGGDQQQHPSRARHK